MISIPDWLFIILFLCTCKVVGETFEDLVYRLARYVNRKRCHIFTPSGDSFAKAQDKQKEATGGKD